MNALKKFTSGNSPQQQQQQSGGNMQSSLIAMALAEAQKLFASKPTGTANQQDIMSSAGQTMFKLLLKNQVRPVALPPGRERSLTFSVPLPSSFSPVTPLHPPSYSTTAFRRSGASFSPTDERNGRRGLGGRQGRHVTAPRHGPVVHEVDTDTAEMIASREYSTSRLQRAERRLGARRSTDLLGSRIALTLSRCQQNRKSQSIISSEEKGSLQALNKRTYITEKTEMRTLRTSSYLPTQLHHPTYRTFQTPSRNAAEPLALAA